MVSPPLQPPTSGASRSPNSSLRTIDDAQLAQDIDAARQLSRARANSIHQHQQIPVPRVIPNASSADRHAGSVSSSRGMAIPASGDGGSVSIDGYASQQPLTPSAIAGRARDPSIVTPSSPAHAFSHFQQQQHQQQHHAAQAQAARFYMQHHRHGSNTSVDSASHFIDHRNQQSNTALGSISPSSYRRTSGRMSTGPSGVTSSFRQQYGGAYGGSALDDELATTHIDDAVQATSYGGQGAHGPSDVRGGRSDRLVDIDDQVNDKRNDGRLASSAHSAEHDHHRSYRDDMDMSRSFGGRADLNAPSEVPHTPSRRPSLAEDDVCFPMHTPAPDVAQQPIEGISGAQPMYSDHHTTQHNRFDQDFLNSIPSGHLRNGNIDGQGSSAEPLPAGYPWTFDLGALEEFSEQEKKRIQDEAASSNQTSWGLRNRSGPATIAGTRDAKRQQSSAQDTALRSGYGASPDSDDATFYSRRPRKFINVPGIEPEGKASGRYQRKLALFEGAGTSPPPIGTRPSTLHAPTVGGGILGRGALLEEELSRHRAEAVAKDSNGYPVDTKTPLLSQTVRSKVPSYQFGDGDEGMPNNAGDAPPVPVSRSMSVGADLSNLMKRARGSQRPARLGTQNRHPSYGSERQYRFTFYSNGLPNTIHARHLFELPAPGQTFEELLTGVEPRRQQATNSHGDGIARGPGGGGEHRTGAHGEAEHSANVAAAPEASSSQSSTGKGTIGATGKPVISALTSALASGGRLEGSTAPNTGTNTPDNAGLHPRPSTATSTQPFASGRLSGHAQTGIGGVGHVAPMDRARALPGGGIGVDQEPESCTWWLDVLCPTDQEMKTLSRAFGIHPLTTEDILMEETREKIELFRNYYLVCFRSFDQDPYSPTYLEPLNMYVIVFREGTLSFHFRATPHPQNVRRRIKQLKDYINVTSDWISYALIDDITDAFGPLIQSIEYEVDSIDELVLILKEAEQSDMLRRIGTCRKKVMGLLRLMGNKADVVKGLAKRCNENWSVAPKSDIGLYLSDIQDHLITMTQNLNHYEKILSRSHSNYLAQISIEMTDANNQINDVLSKLTALGTVIIPLNVITGLWGMNVNVPGQGVDSLDWFFGILGVMVGLAVCGYFATIRYLSR